MNMRFFCDTAWNHKNVQSKIAQKTKNGQQVSCQRKQKNVE